MAVKLFATNSNYNIPELCRTCLSTTEINLSEIHRESSEFNKLYVCCTELDLRTYSKPNLCVPCNEVIRDTYQLIVKHNEQMLNGIFLEPNYNQLLHEFEDDKLNIEEIDLSDLKLTLLKNTNEIMALKLFTNKSNFTLPEFCRICLSTTEINLSGTHIESSEFNKLYVCCPELDLHIYSKPIVCVPCASVINFTHQFINNQNVQNESILKEIDLTNCEPILHNKVIQIRKKIRKGKKTNLSYRKGYKKSFKCSVCSYTCKNKKDFECHVHIRERESVNKIVPKEVNLSNCEHALRKKTKIIIRRIRTSRRKQLYRRKGYNKYFKCSACGYRCNNKKDFERHILHIQQTESIKCRLCDFINADLYTMKKHVFNAHCRKNVKTQFCGCSFCNYKKDNMMNNFNDEKPFKCSICGYSCDNKKDFDCHILHIQETLSIKCPLCDYINADLYTMKEHVLNVHCRKKSKKQFCGCSFCNYKEDNMMNNSNDEKRFKCSKCICKFIKEQSLKSHILQIHTAKQHFKCFSCSYSTQRKGTLIRHMIRFHNDKRKSKCTKCGHASIENDILQTYVLRNDDKKQFCKCSFCDCRKNDIISNSNDEIYLK